jgi:hypothetical protein
MIDRALGFGPIQQDSYYFQLIPLSLSIISKESELPAEGTTYRFSVAKGILSLIQASKNSTKIRSQF